MGILKSLATIVVVVLVLLIKLQVLSLEANNNPDLAPQANSLACETVNRSHTETIDRAVKLMRNARIGEDLYIELVERNTCIAVDSLHESVLAMAVTDANYIVASQDLLEDESIRVVAATFVHEATHIVTIQDGLDCRDSCTLIGMSGGTIALELEIPAYRAEAQYWLEKYGSDGKANPQTVEEVALNHLMFAYQQGERAFVRFVRIHLGG